LEHLAPLVGRGLEGGVERHQVGDELVELRPVQVLAGVQRGEVLRLAEILENQEPRRAVRAEQLRHGPADLRPGARRLVERDLHQRAIDRRRDLRVLLDPRAGLLEDEGALRGHDPEGEVHVPFARLGDRTELLGVGHEALLAQVLLETLGPRGIHVEPTRDRLPKGPLPIR
jgi:hypothetical protein